MRQGHLESITLDMEKVLKPIFESLDTRLGTIESRGGMMGALGAVVGKGGVERQSSGPGAPTDRIAQLERRQETRLRDLEARMGAKAVCVSGRWFRTRKDCEDFARDSMPEGQFHWVSIDVVTLLQFVGKEIVDHDASKGDEVHSAKVERTHEQSVVISAFKTDILPIFSGPSESTEASCPLPGLRTPERWDCHDRI